MCNQLMVLPNAIALFALSGTVVKIAKAHNGKKQAAELEEAAE